MIELFEKEEYNCRLVEDMGEIKLEFLSKSSSPIHIPEELKKIIVEDIKDLGKWRKLKELYKLKKELGG